jgi:hypothetical protein
MGTTIRQVSLTVNGETKPSVVTNPDAVPRHVREDVQSHTPTVERRGSLMRSRAGVR